MPRDLFSNQLKLQGSQSQQSNGLLSSLFAFPPQSPSDLQGAAGVKTFLGTMPMVKQLVSGFTDPDSLKEALMIAGSMVGGGMVVKEAKVAWPVVKKAIDYLRPWEESKKFMQELGGGKTAEENIQELAKRISFGRKSAVDEALSHKDPVYRELGEKEFKANDFLDHGLITKWFSKSSPVGELNEKFLQNSTLNNSDDLQQQIGARIGDLLKKSLREPLDKIEVEELSDLKKSRDYLVKDQDKFIESQDPYLANQNKIFRQKWRENVTIYDDNPVLSEIARKGTTEGFTPSEIKRVFSYPTEKVQKILKDITSSGKGNVLYNELQGSEAPSAGDLSKALMEAKQFGYQHYITPEMENKATDLAKREILIKHLETVGGGLAGYAIGGIPGATIGVGIMSPFIRSMIRNLLEKSGKKL